MNTPPSDFEQERKRMLLAVFDAVSHDLKTPLACILGSLEIIERMNTTLGTHDRDALIHTAILEARKLDNLISDMLARAQPK